MLRDHCIFVLAEEEGRICFDIIYLILYQFEIITWWCLSVMEYVMEFVLNSTLRFVMKFIMMKKN